MRKNLKAILVLLILSFGGCHLAFSQFTASGKITELSTKEPLIGATVVIKGTTTGTVTDVDGNFSIQIPGESAILEISFIGFLTQEVEVTPSNNEVDVQLNEDAGKLGEIVVTGLASSIKRSNLANAVSTVSAKELTGTTTPQTLDGALYGKLTGANIVANSGAPGGGISMKLRGITTITGSSEPLYIVDGVYMDNSAISSGVNTVTQAQRNGGITSQQDNPSNRIADLNPGDIENIEILKGASAAAIYGARANAGVVIITTKKGRDGKTNISFKQDLGIATMLNYLGQRNFTEEIVLNTFNEDEKDKFVAARNAGELVDYEREMYGNIGFLRNTSLSISGGNEKTRFYVSGSLRGEEGIIKNTGFVRNSIRANIDHTVSDIVDISFNSNYINSSTDRGLTNNDNSGVSYGIALSSTVPWAKLFPDQNGNYPDNPYAASNPLQTRDLSTINESVNRVLTGLGVNINFVRNTSTLLKLALRGGVDYYNNESTVYFPETLQFMKGSTNGFYSRGNNVNLNTNASAILVFNKTFSKLDLTSQLGITRLDFNQERLTTQATQLIGGQKNLEQASAINVFNRRLNTTDIGYFFQQEANFDDKIILTAGIRFDQSSLNGNPNKLYAFPKASVAANISNFGFWNISGINAFKLRFAYGQAGGVPSPNAVTLAQPAFTTFEGGNIDGQSGSIISNTRGNRDIRPERSNELEAGFDISVANSKVNLAATYYNKTVDDLILLAQIPASSGFSFQTINGGALNNQGVELALTTTPVNTTNIMWDLRTSFWLNRSKMTRLDIPAFITGGFSTALGSFKIEEGRPATQIVGVVPGIDGETVVGNSEPDFQMSLYNTITFFRNFEFSFLLHWKQGGDNINLTKLLSDFGGTTYDYDDDDDGNGVVNGDQRIQAFVGENPDTREFVEDATYLKVREIALYYTLPSSLFNDRATLKVGVSGNNVFMLTKYDSYDPEVSNFGNNGISTGVEVTPFPSSRRMFFHVALDF